MSPLFREEEGEQGRVNERPNAAISTHSHAVHPSVRWSIRPSSSPSSLPSPPPPSQRNRRRSTPNPNSVIDFPLPVEVPSYLESDNIASSNLNKQQCDDSHYFLVRMLR
ncbi:unnamed protein product [Angiostrongylus costaricensis]|uniref:Uncharacterized protein n=1 Tax=Angiostrongylus costaricensis TaxID=334426 RepID=A0A0R3PWP8_ANGCS|nr:unnamed protein product [Angiostrongylus costaricensis]